MAAVLEFRLTGGSTNSDPDQSLGGVSSSNELSLTAMNNLFDNVTPTEASAGDVEYRAIDIWNSGDATAENVNIYMSTETSSADSQLDFYNDGTTHDGTDQGDTIGSEDTEPSGSTWSHYTSSSKLSLPNIPASNGTRVWVRRTISSGASNTPSDQGTITVEYA